FFFFYFFFFFFSSRRRHTRSLRDWSSDVCSSDLPMVDVMLVLLIIFMVSAPLLTVGVPIDLPQSQAKSLDQDKEPLTISVNTKGEIFLQNSQIAVEELVPRLQAIAQARGSNGEERIFVRGDRKVVDKPAITPTADQVQPPPPEPVKIAEPKPRPPTPKPEPKQREAFAPEPKPDPKPDPIAETIKREQHKKPEPPKTVQPAPQKK